jgi:hypothetical protein
VEEEKMNGRDGVSPSQNKIRVADTATLPNQNMKTAYELAMERLSKTAPAVKLTNAQKRQLAELDSKYAAKVAEREIALKDEIARTDAAGDLEKVETLRQQLVVERKKLQAELEGKKEQLRRAVQ